MSRPSACPHNSYNDNCPDCAQDNKVRRLEAEVQRLKLELKAKQEVTALWSLMGFSDLAQLIVRTTDDRMQNYLQVEDTRVYLEKRPTLQDAKAQWADAHWCLQRAMEMAVEAVEQRTSEPLTIKPDPTTLVAAIAAGAVPGPHWPEGRTYERRHGVPAEQMPQVLHGTPLNDQDGDFHFRYGTPPSTAVTATHGPTGLVTTCGDHRSLLKNKGAALKALKQKLLEACSRDFRILINRFPTLEEIEAAEREAYVILNVFDPESFDRVGLNTTMDVFHVARLLATHGLRSSSYHAILLAAGGKTPEVAAADWLRDLRAEPILRPLTTRPLMGFEKEP